MRTCNCNLTKLNIRKSNSLQHIGLYCNCTYNSVSSMALKVLTFRLRARLTQSLCWDKPGPSLCQAHSSHAPHCLFQGHRGFNLRLGFWLTVCAALCRNCRSALTWVRGLVVPALSHLFHRSYSSPPLTTCSMFWRQVYWWWGITSQAQSEGLSLVVQARGTRDISGSNCPSGTNKRYTWPCGLQGHCVYSTQCYYVKEVFF